MKKITTVACAVLLLSACATMRSDKPAAAAELAPTKGNTAKGTVTFTPRGDRVLVTADVSGLAPGPHGFHIHEKGDCGAADASSAGGHFNPTASPHGKAESGAHHAGDIDNIVADASGVAHVNAHVAGAVLGGGGGNDIAGRAIVVHAAPDDDASQPAGNAGARIACGVIAVSG